MLDISVCNHSTEDAISTILHTVLTHLEKKNTYARIVYVTSAHPTESDGESSPGFKPDLLSLNSWHHLTERSVRFGKNTSITLNPESIKDVRLVLCWSH